MRKITNRKKLAVITLLILLINAFMPILTIAEGEATLAMSISGEEKECYLEDETFTVNVELSNTVSGAKVLGGTINFDESKLEIVNVVRIDDPDHEMYEIDTDTSIGQQVNIISFEPGQGITFAFNKNRGLSNGSFQLVFKVKTGATAGTTDITFGDIAYSDGAATNQTDYPINCDQEVSVVIGPIAPPSVPITSISVSPKTLTLGIDETSGLTVTWEPENTTDSTDVIWTSSDDSIATVSNGVVTGVGPGETTITATIGNHSDTATVKVTSSLQSIEITPTGSITLVTNMTDKKTVDLEIKYTPSNTTDSKDITWKSSNTEVATVDSNGVVTAVSEGQTIITATSAVEGVAAATKTINVITAIDDMSISPATVTLIKNVEGENTKDLELVTSPVSATKKTTAWTSSDENVVTVDTNGKITAVGGGNATITCTVNDGLKTIQAQCQVTVEVQLQSISIGENFELYKGQVKQLEVTKNPSDTTVTGDVTWSVNEEGKDFVSVDQTGKVKALKPGTATITATFGDKQASVVVTVPEVHITTVKMDKENLTLERGKEGEQLNVIILPENTTDSTEVTWESSNEKCVTVVDGYVTAVAVPEEDVTITATVGEYTATCTVKVVSYLTSIQLSDSEITLKRGVSGQDTKTVTLESYAPTDTTDDLTITWKSNKESVATVDENGKITAVSAGDATITATVGTVTATVAVHVDVPLQSISIKSSTDLIKNQSETLVVTYNPSDTSDSKNITWTSSDESVATVDNNGKVTAKSKGTVTITATSAVEGVAPATCTVNVTEINLTEIKIDNKIDILYEGQTHQLDILFTPANTTDDKDIEWYSTDESIATVDENGKVTAIAEGNVTIYAAIKGTVIPVNTGSSRTNIRNVGTGAKLYDSFDLTVKPSELTGLTTDTGENTAEIGSEIVIEPIFNAEGATGNVTYLSSDESVATVDPLTGKVTPKTAGKVVITAVDEYGNTSEIELTITEAQAEDAKKSDSPKTGDINIVLYVTLMIISLFGIIRQIKRRK